MVNLSETRHTGDFNVCLERMAKWEVTGIGLHPGGSNYVFVALLSDSIEEKPEDLYCIYKPAAGERPLRDFSYGTLHLRERAAFILSRYLGWPTIPPTVIRNGPHGEGSFQLFIDHDPSDHFFSMRDAYLQRFAPVAMFDVLVNNADRKGGSVLHDQKGFLWAIDHGLTFNYETNIRTVMLEFSGQPYPPDLLKRVGEAERNLKKRGELFIELASLIGSDVVEALEERAGQMTKSKHFPTFDASINIPYPFI